MIKQFITTWKYNRTLSKIANFHVMLDDLRWYGPLTKEAQTTCREITILLSDLQQQMKTRKI